MSRVWERWTDVGNELGDPTLNESLLFHPLFDSWDVLLSQWPQYVGQPVDARSVVFIGDEDRLPESELPSHVMMGRSVPHIPPDWFQLHHNTMSTLGICSSNAITPLSEFLSQQPSDSTLHHLLIRNGWLDVDIHQRRTLLATLLQALNCPRCKIDGFVLENAFRDNCLLVAETLLQPLTPDGCRGCRFRSLGFKYCLFQERVIQVLVEMLQSPTSKLSELSLYGSCDFVVYFETLCHFAMALRQGHCKLTRLDIRYCSIDDKGLKLLFESLQDGQQSIQDLGLSINSNQEAMSLLRAALGSPYFRFQTLRLVLGMAFEQEAATSLAEALGGQRCKVRVLDLTLHREIDVRQGLQCFCQTLQQQPHKVQCLRFYIHNMLPRSLQTFVSILAGFLSSNGCPLLWLECRFHDPNVGDVQESSLAEALENNYRLCTLSFPWKNRAAEARASSFLERNRLYRWGGLLEQEFVTPRTAKLFICGHAEVGKTTLRNCLLKASTPCNQYLGCGPIVHLHGAKAARTRGMELHTLSFSPCGGESKQLVICDLAGQQEYHAFHHYFVSGSNKDLFLVVCKYHASLAQEELESQLEYWLRFIVCHRSSASIATKPKVIVLLNFFYDAKDMNKISQDRCSHLLDKYRDELDFGLQGEEHVFGIVATKTSQVIPLIDELENLLGQLLLNRTAIPKICDQISSHIVQKFLQKGRLCGIQYSSKTLFLPYSQLLHSYFQNFCTQVEDTPSQESFQAALSELHNAGQIVFFRPIPGAGLQTDPLIITDCGWFCHDLIGSLLAPIELRKHFNRSRVESWVWDEEDVKQMLRNQKCEEKYLDEILRYLHSLELCYPITLPESPHKLYLLFPALLRNDVCLPEPVNQGDMIFLGRRMKCQDTAKQLLPSGVFARLQVKLHGFCGNSSYKVGYSWIGFSEDFVRVTIRFGGDTGRWEDRQWIDILISFSDNKHSWIADNIMGNIKALVHETCQDNERGCPTVLLQECVLRDSTPGSEALPLALIQAKVLKKGLQSSVVWADGECVETIQVLLPSELKQHATQQLHAVTDVQMEFSATDENSRGSLSHSWEVEEAFSELDLPLQTLYQLINGRFDQLEANISGSLRDIKTEITKLAGQLQEVQKNILSNCSTHLLTQLLDSPLPLYPYLTDPDGKWKRLMSLIVGERMQLHFLCEEGPHEIQNQEGLTVTVKTADWVVKVAPVLVPALRVFCCAARLAATMYLPGSHVFIPYPDCLQSLGLNDNALQRQSYPEPLKALVSGISNLDHQSLLRGQPLQESQLKDCLSDLLRGQDVDMRKDFLLHRVVIHGGKVAKRNISWVCPQHAQGRKVLREDNPFA